MRASDVVKQSKFVLPKFFGVVVLEGDREIGSGCVVWGVKNRPYLSLEITPELRTNPIFMVKAARQLIKEAIEEAGELFTIEDKDEPTAPRFLSFLGFEPTGEEIQGERVLKWQR
jgi:hypothetical protein